MKDVTDLDAMCQQLSARGGDVVDDEEQALRRPRCGVGHVRAEDDRTR
jgi:hypothetical protein